MMSRLLCVLVMIVSMSTFIGCSECNIEGDLKYFYGEQATGIEVSASPVASMENSNDSEVIKAVTDEKGWFHLEGLLPETDYHITVNGFIMSSKCIAKSPEDGTTVVPNSLVICPTPPSEGAWLFDNEMTKQKMQQVTLTSHPDIAKRRYNSHRHSEKVLSVSDEDVSKSPTFNRDDGYLLLRNMGFTNRMCEVPLYEIKAKSFNMGQKRYGVDWLNVPGGWYYNIREFKIDTLGGGVLRYVVFVPGVKEIRCGNYTANFSSNDLKILMLNRFEPGVYLVTLDRSDETRGGFIIRIAEGE